jgi:hypothetical protein
MISLLFKRMKHSNITYNANTRVTLIDNSLIKALEIANNRKLKLAKIRDTTKVIEMSESHDIKPHIKTTDTIHSYARKNL